MVHASAARSGHSPAPSLLQPYQLITSMGPAARSSHPCIALDRPLYAALGSSSALCRIALLPSGSGHRSPGARCGLDLVLQRVQPGHIACVFMQVAMAARAERNEIRRLVASPLAPGHEVMHLEEPAAATAGSPAAKVIPHYHFSPHRRCDGRVAAVTRLVLPVGAARPYSGAAGSRADAFLRICSARGAL